MIEEKNVNPAPFFETDENPADQVFAGSEAVDVPVESKSPDTTAQVMALATADMSKVDPINNPTGTYTYLEQQVMDARDQLARLEETAVRRKVAAQRTLQRHMLLGSSALANPAFGVSQEIAKDVYAVSAANMQDRYNSQIRSALERQAVERAQELAMAGDPVQAKIILNRMTPGRENAASVWQDYLVTQTALMQKMEKAKREDDQEGWVQAAYTGLLSLIQPSAFSYLGNVDEGVGGYTPSMLRFFFPGSEVNAQVEAFWRMNAEERLDYIDKLDANITNNASNGWVLNPDKKLELYEQFVTPAPDASGDMNVFNALELGLYVAPEIGMIPYRSIKRAASIPGVLVGAGARKEAANAISKAYDDIIKNGTEASRAANGIEQDEVIDGLMPSIINPEGVGDLPDGHISLSGETNTYIEQARAFLEEWKLLETSRYTTQEELTAAIEKTREKVAARFGGSVILDAKPAVTKLADGTTVNSVEVVLGRPGGGLFATEAEARGFAAAHSYDDIGVTEIGPSTKVVPHEDDGYTIVAYHGSKDTFEAFDNAHLGKTTMAGSAKEAHFFASPKGNYTGKTKLEFDQEAEAFKKEWGPIESKIRAFLDRYDLSNLKPAWGPGSEKTKDFDFPAELKALNESLSDKEILDILEYVYNNSPYYKKNYATLGEYLDVYNKSGKIESTVELRDFLDLFDSKVDELSSADPQNAINIAWSYARMANEPEGAQFAVESTVTSAFRTKYFDIVDKRYENISSNWMEDVADLFSKGDKDLDELIQWAKEDDRSYLGWDTPEDIWHDISDLKFGGDPALFPPSSKQIYERLKPEYKAPYVDKADIGAKIYPVKIKSGNLKIVEGDRAKYSDISYTEELRQAKEEGFEGVVFKSARDPGHPLPGTELPADGSYDVIAIFDPENIRMALSPGRVIQDSSGGYAFKVKMDIPDTAFITNPLSPPPQGFLAKFWKNISQTSDKTVFNKAVMADQKFARIQKLIDEDLTKTFRELRTKERVWVNQVLAKGQQEQRWFTDNEFNVLIERATGKPANERMLKAYNQYRFNNDLEYALRNDGLYREKVIRGYESVKFFAQNRDFDIDGVVKSMDVVPSARIYNISDDVHYAADNAISPTKLKELEGKGYRLVRLEKPIELPDGVEVNWIVGKGEDVSLRPLRREQLGYTPGGHVLYTDPIFIKQAIKRVHPDTGQEYWAEPSTFATAANIKDARDYVRIMEAARKAVIDGKDAEYLDEVVFAGKGGPVESNLPYPSGKEFIEQMESGRISRTEAFEAVYDRELPTAYHAAGVDISRFMNEEDLTGLAGYFRQTGRMYYSKKGDQLRSVKGGLAPVVDPFEAQSRALTNVARMSASFSDFKTNAIDRWVKTYYPYLDSKTLSEDTLDSPFQLFNVAQPRQGLPSALVQQMTGQRESIKRILSFQTEFERGYHQWMRSMAEWVVGDSDNILRKKISEGVMWFDEKNPLNALRGIAFDMKLGMFNIGQFFIQTSTMASALALNPVHGKFGLASAMPVWWYFLKKGDENILETLANRGVWKLAGFSDKETWKAYTREAYQSGFFNLGDTHAMVNDSGFASTFGMMGNKVHDIREMGRFFFYNAEVLNRLVAHRIAFGEAVEKYGIDAMGGVEFKEFVAGRAENYSFNMSGVSKSWWQSGILSVPTQFWAYNVRMIEALTGSNFTAAQKLRLAGMQLLMAGSAGIPVVAGVSEYMKNKYGDVPPIDSFLGTVDRGFGDRLIYELFGADVKASAKWGTGAWSSDLIKDLLGLSEYNEKSFAEVALGATGSILFQTLGPVFELTKYYMTHESGAEQIDLDNEQWIKLFSNISTVGNGLKAMLVYQTRQYRSNQGNILVDNIPQEDAIMIAMGFQPSELDVMAARRAYNNNRAETVKEAAQQITRWRQEAFGNPSLMQENAQKVNAFVRLLPADIRKDALRQAHRQTDPSLYRSIEERYKKNEHKAEIARLIQGNEQ